MSANNTENTTNSTKPPQLILKHKGDIINGMMMIEIESLDDLHQPEFFQQFSLCYNIHVPNNNEPYYNTWHSTDFTIFSISEHNGFALKVPLFLLSYSLEYNLTIKSFMFHDSDEAEGNAFELLSTITSPDYLATIPSILMEPVFIVDDRVQFNVRDAAYVMSGTIAKVLGDDMVEIELDDGYVDATTNDTVITHTSQLLRYPVRNCFIVDLTNRTQSELRCIVRNTSDISSQTYWELCDTLNGLFVNEMFNIDRMIEEGESGNPRNFEYMSGLVAVYIHQFLFPPQYNHKIKCLLGDTNLLLEQQWTYFLWRNRQDIRKGYKVNEPQELRTDRDIMGYTCDICRMEVNWYEFVYHCECKGDGHDFCVSCVDACCAQYETMQPFVAQLLCDRLNDHCIEEVVSFCVGKINTFHIEQKDVEMTTQDKDSIDDSTYVGGKRTMDVDVPRRKKRRVE
eukprot:23896_1